MRQFRFGVEMKEPFPGQTWTQSALELEQLGYDTVFVPDHLHSPWGPLATMAAIAATTTRIRVAPLVLACDLRNPAVVAKELATIDAISGGRLVVGLGAGYNPLDYERSGIPMATPGVRVSRMIEYTAILRACFTGEPGASVDVRGEHFDVVGMVPGPGGSSPSGPPILIGGGGRRVLRHAALHADIVGVNPSTAAGRDDPATFRDALPTSIDSKFQLVRETAGDRFDHLEFNAWISWAAITDDALGQAAGLAEWVGCTAAELLESPLVLVGSQAQVIDQLERRRERWGYHYMCLPQSEARTFAPVVAELSGR